MKVLVVFIFRAFEHFFHQTHIEHLLLYIPKETGLYINVFVD